VGLITPSTYVSDPDRLALAERTLKYFDLKPKFGKNVRKRNGYLGGSIEEYAPTFLASKHCSPKVGR
jgi:muramoyltetrapeptide carboxypeptidase LdcA involved in peptidoglycan recycling